MSGALAFIIGLLIGVILTYFAIQNNIISITGSYLSTSSNNNFNSQQNGCFSQVNNADSILQDKLTSGSQVNIINSTIFGTVDSNQSISDVYAWAHKWSSQPLASDLAPFNECNNLYGDDYFCNDLRVSYNQGFSVEGVIVRAENQGTGGVLVFPVLCGNGNLLTNSSNFIESGA